MQELLADTYSAKPDDGKDQPARATLPLETIVRACRLQCQAFPPSTTSWRNPQTTTPPGIGRNKRAATKKEESNQQGVTQPQTTKPSPPQPRNSN